MTVALSARSVGQSPLAARVQGFSEKMLNKYHASQNLVAGNMGAGKSISPKPPTTAFFHLTCIYVEKFRHGSH